MRVTLTRSLKTAALGLAFLFAAGTQQAVAMPLDDHDFGTLGSGTFIDTEDLSTRANPEIALWFAFDLSVNSAVEIDTELSSLDTVLALYDDTGNLLGQNDDCGLLLTSCLSFGNLATGSYQAGVTLFPGTFAANWFVNEPEFGEGEITLRLRVKNLDTPNPVPLPAAVWLFGTALIGFVGMSRRTSIKS